MQEDTIAVGHDPDVIVRSSDADLVILGLTRQEILKDTKSALISHPNLKDVLFVNSRQRISIF